MSFDAKSIQSALQKAKRPELARILSGVWNISLTEYSARFWEKTAAPPPLEVELQQAFANEFCRIGFTEEQAQGYCASVCADRMRRSALATPPSVAATPATTPFATSRLSPRRPCRQRIMRSRLYVASTFLEVRHLR